MTVERYRAKGRPDLGDGDAFEGVHQEHAGDEVTCPRGQMRRQVVDAALQCCEPEF